MLNVLKALMYGFPIILAFIFIPIGIGTLIYFFSYYVVIAFAIVFVLIASYLTGIDFVEKV